MKTKIISSVLLMLCCAKGVVAQTNDAGLNNSSAASLAPAQVVGSGFAESADSEVVPLISLHSEFPLIDAIANLAQQAGVEFQLAPELQTNGAPVSRLQEPVGMVRYENVTYREALDALIEEKDLVLGTAAGSNTLVLGTPESDLQPIPMEGGDLAETVEDEAPQLEAFFDPNKEVPLITAIQMLGRLAELNLMIDPRLKTGGIRQVINILSQPAAKIQDLAIQIYAAKKLL